MEQLHAIQQNVLQTYSVGLQAMQGPTVHGPNGSTTNPNFEALPGGARPINFQPDSESAQSLPTASLGVTNSSSGASKTSGATTPVSDSSATSLTLDSIFVPPALPPLAPPSAPAAPVITTTAPAQNSASSIDIAGIAKVNSTVTLFNNGSTVGTATADSGGHWSVPGVALSSGLDYTFTATATDATGTSAPSTALSFHDSQAAVATVTALSADTGTAGDFITSVAAQTVSGSYSGTLGGGREDPGERRRHHLDRCDGGRRDMDGERGDAGGGRRHAVGAQHRHRRQHHGGQRPRLHAANHRSERGGDGDGAERRHRHRRETLSPAWRRRR